MLSECFPASIKPKTYYPWNESEICDTPQLFWNFLSLQEQYWATKSSWELCNNHTLEGRIHEAAISSADTWHPSCHICRKPPQGRWRHTWARSTMAETHCRRPTFPSTSCTPLQNPESLLSIVPLLHSLSVVDHGAQPLPTLPAFGGSPAQLPFAPVLPGPYWTRRWPSWRQWRRLPDSSRRSSVQPGTGTPTSC